MITVKLRDIVDNREAITELQNVKLPIKVAYRIKRLVDKLNSILKAFNENKNELIVSLGEKQKDDSIQVTEQNMDTYHEKLDELLDIEEKIDFQKIAIEELGDIAIEPRLIVGFIFR